MTIQEGLLLIAIVTSGSVFILMQAMSRSNIVERKRMEDALRFVAQDGWTANGEQFLPIMAEYLGKTLGMDYVIVDKLTAATDIAETVALFAKGKILPNMQYSLNGTPCENVMEGSLCCYAAEVQRQFPDDVMLAEMGVESYVGLPLWDSAGNVIGLIAVMDGKPISDGTAVTELLQLMAVRAAAELERAQSEQALRVREREFRALAENSPDPIFRYDRECRRIYVNRAVERLTGKPAALLLQGAPADAAVDPSREGLKVIQCIQEVLDTGQPVESETEFITPDEVLHYFHNRYVPEWDDDGKVASVLCVCRDITERKLAQEAMLHARGALEDAQRIAHIGSWDVDLINDVLTWSDETFRIWEIDQTKFAATFAAFLETVHPDDREKVSYTYNQSIINKTLYQIEHRLLFPDGRVKYIQERGEPYFDEGGHPIRFIGTSLDVTEHKRFEELVSLQNHALDHMGEAVYLVDEEARILHVNNAACKMLGYSHDELLARRICDLDPYYDPVKWRQHWNDLLYQKTITLETVHISKTGVLVPIEVNANAIEHDGRRVNFALVRDITERKRIEAQMHHQASYDTLTGLPNRRLFGDRLREEISKAERSGSNVSVLFIDLDRFKEVNDTLGHHYGDQLLIQAAHRIQQCVRESDTLARLGGDEFVLVLPGVTEMSHLGRVAQCIIEAMASPFVLDNQISYVSASIGIANYPADVDSFEGLISAADQAMYVAKERGRNGFSFFTPAMQKQVQQRLSLANDLREAMLKEQLQICLQPIVDISSGHVVKAEALIRWKHPQHGMVPPDKFIPIAEEMGLIYEIGDWVFRQAAQAMSHWLGMRTAENGCCQISVNMSARQFTQSDIGTAWINHLAAINVPPHHVVIEITESLLLGDEVDIMGKLQRFREAGMKLALDDFGTGYSAMSYLKRFNIDYLKIDRSFVRDLETDPNDRAIVEAIVAMAHKLGLKTIAEGVETEPQKAILAEVGCDYVQGYLYAKPLPVEEFLAFVRPGVQ